MSETPNKAPEHVWVDTFWEDGDAWGHVSIEYQGEGDTQYIRADTAAAQVAAAYERAAAEMGVKLTNFSNIWHRLFVEAGYDAFANRLKFLTDELSKDFPSDIRALTADTQTDALEQVRREAELAGYERGARLAEKLAEALRTIESHRRKCHEHDDDCGHFRRTFDAEDVRLMEWQARAAIKEWYDGDPDEQTKAQELAFRKAVSS